MLEYIKGMDVSSMDAIEQLGAVFYDEGKQGDLLEILKKYGSDYIRLRLWNDPKMCIRDSIRTEQSWKKKEQVMY